MGLETVSHVTYATRSSVVAVGVTLPLLAILAVGLRFYTRHAQKTSLWVDDWLTLPALVSNQVS